MELIRCPWCENDAEYTRYHDEEWGVPQRDAERLFEALVLDGAQAGLSWLTILRRREGYRACFDGMRPQAIARYGEADIARLMADARIIRNRRKIESAIGNARAYLAMRDAGQDFASWMWDWTDGRPIVNRYRTMAEVPAFTPLSAAVSKALRGKGFTFVGPVIIYAFMQASGLVNDHLIGCFRRTQCVSPII
jgi:DNA-3-methyladenine glycosylase I